MMELEEALRRLAEHRTDEVVVTTMTGNLVWPVYSKSDADLIFTAPMGGVPGVALGIALARPDVRVWAINGDGSTLMYLSSLVDITEVLPHNLVYFLMDNREWGLIGHLSLPAAERVDFLGLAKDTGWEHVHDVRSTQELDAAILQIKNEQGPIFVDLRVSPSEPSRAGTPYYAERMSLPKCSQSYGKSGVANVQAYLAARR
ncbi:MAG: hypothetical protein HYX92_07800 [Chloroflexi bacterium]|nr:hypothetical protein [Chloroflexota bacterium]